MVINQPQFPRQGSQYYIIPTLNRGWGRYTIAKVQRTVIYTFFFILIKFIRFSSIFFFLLLLMGRNLIFYWNIEGANLLSFPCIVFVISRTRYTNYDLILR